MALYRNGEVTVHRNMVKPGDSEQTAKAALAPGAVFVLRGTQDSNEYLVRIKEQLQKRLKQFADAVVAGEVQVDEDGIHLERKPADPEDLRVSELRRALYASRSLGQISGKILRIDSKLLLSWQFFGRKPYNCG